MVPKRKTFTLAAADADGYVNDATGVGPWTTMLGAPSDGMAHKITLTTGVDLSAISITVTGKDPEGRDQTETITAPNATTATGTKYFQDGSVVSFAASATLGANTCDFGWAAACVTPAIPVNPYAHNGPTVGVDIGGTVTYTGQQTNGPVFDVSSESLLWTAISSGMTGATTDQFAAATATITAFRIAVASHTSGTLAITYAQDRSAA